MASPGKNGWHGICWITVRSNLKYGVAMQITSVSSYTSFPAESERSAGFAAQPANPAGSVEATAPQTEVLPAANPSDAAVSLSNEALALQRGEPVTAQPALTYAGLPRTRTSANSTTSSPSRQQVRYPDASVLASLRAAGIPVQPAFELAVNPANGKTSVIGTRLDASRIEKLINHSES
jgi:hypothetical protein